MKQALKIVAIIVIIAAAIIGCNRVDLVSPTLIAPADSAALYSGLTFIWSSGQEAEEYVIHVWTGSTDVIQETLTDTTYVMSDSAFSALTYGAYNWAVASKAGSRQEWSETRSFSLSQPGAPVLIAPADGAVFDAEPPTFVWHADSLNPDYAIRIFTDSSIVLQDTTSDTSYVMSVSVFDTLENGTYSWWVGSVVTNGLILSSTRTFTIEKPVPVDLDTTYFPFGLGYKWCYERHDYYWDIWGTESDTYDTIVIQVQDSTYDSIGWLFDLSEYFYDVCAEGSEARINVQSPNTFLVPICVNWWWLRDTVFVSLTPSTRTKPIKIEYNSDTLCMSGSYEDEMIATTYTQSTKRLKGIGIVWQNDAKGTCTGKFEGYKKDRLLYFYNGQDTIYKTP